MPASKKLYVEIAQTIGIARFNAADDSARHVIDQLAYDLAGDFKRDNASFDRARFLAHVDKVHADAIARAAANLAESNRVHARMMSGPSLPAHIDE